MNKRKFKFYSDGGHGWLAVKRKLLADLGIIDKITRFSYQRGQTVYLEEDVDVGHFFKAWLAKYDSKPIIEERYHGGSSPIRNYEAFTK